MLEDPAGHIRRIADFMQIGGLPAAQVETIRRVSSFQVQQEREALSWDLWFARLVGWRKYYRLRRGKVNESAEPRYSAEMCVELERQYKEVLEPLGVPCPWVLGSDRHKECKFLNVSDATAAWDQGPRTTELLGQSAGLAAGPPTPAASAGVGRDCGGQRA